jgi:uncharacterized protein
MYAAGNPTEEDPSPKTVKAAEILLNARAEMELKDREGMTALHWASRKGQIHVLRLLIEKGAKLNSRDKKGWTPLMHAVDGGNEKSARLLVEKGADKNIKSMDGKRALDLAQSPRMKSLHELLK